ncbi:MAG: hypothetical protein U5O39_07340 [Gammaproteobacteria bacterium]|nr:hypothetical protein [Gammaproteobacteria bacterium]
MKTAAVILMGAASMLLAACATTTPVATCWSTSGPDSKAPSPWRRTSSPTAANTTSTITSSSCWTSPRRIPTRTTNVCSVISWSSDVSDRATISKRQARDIYNRYFNVKFVSLTGDYNTCTQTCPTRAKVLAEMQRELADKELGLVQATRDPNAYYRADLLLKEAQLVLEATCRACEAGE